MVKICLVHTEKLLKCTVLLKFSMSKWLKRLFIWYTPKNFWYVTFFFYSSWDIPSPFRYLYALFPRVLYQEHTEKLTMVLSCNYTLIEASDYSRRMEKNAFPLVICYNGRDHYVPTKPTTYQHFYTWKTEKGERWIFNFLQLNSNRLAMSWRHALSNICQLSLPKYMRIRSLPLHTRWIWCISDLFHDISDVLMSCWLVKLLHIFRSFCNNSYYIITDIVVLPCVCCIEVGSPFVGSSYLLLKSGVSGTTFISGEVSGFLWTSAVTLILLDTPMKTIELSESVLVSGIFLPPKSVQDINPAVRGHMTESFISI